MGEPIHIRSRVSSAVIKITSADHLTRFSIKKIQNYQTSGHDKVTFNFRLAGNVGFSDHCGKPKPFSNHGLVTENQKSIANAAIF